MNLTSLSFPAYLTIPPIERTNERGTTFPHLILDGSRFFTRLEMERIPYWLGLFGRAWAFSWRSLFWGALLLGQHWDRELDIGTAKRARDGIWVLRLSVWLWVLHPLG